MMLWLYGFFMAWGMFLALPCPFRKWDEAARGHMLACLPLVGLVVGGLWALAAWLLKLLSCPAGIAALVLAAVPWLVTGFIHLDGFMDVCDAVLSRRDIEARRRILKDPHCGAFAVICLVLLALFEYGLFLSAEAAPHPLCLALIPVASRACAAVAVLKLRPIEGSQYAKGGSRSNALLILPIVMLIVSCALPAALYGFSGIAPICAAVFYWLSALYGKKQLGGISGDISGFALVLAEALGAAAAVLVI